MGDVQQLAKRVIIIDKGVILYDGLLQKIVEKFAPFKVIEVDFGSEIDSQKLNTVGEIKSYANLHASIHVRRDEAAKKASKLLDLFDVADLTIQDPAIEDIIRQVFNQNSK